MIKTVLFFTYFGISLFLSIFFALIYLILGALRLKTLQQNILITTTKLWAKSIIFVSGNRVQVENASVVPEETALFVVNHQSYFDIPVLMAYVPHFVGFIAKVELERVPMLSWWMKQMGCLFMDRQDMRQSLRIILEGIESLKTGHSLVIFPEGTRGDLGEMKNFKPGSLKLAVKAGVPIVPVTLKNTYKIYEEHQRVRKTDVTICFHEPIDVTTLERDALNNLHNEVQAIIKNALER